MRTSRLHGLAAAALATLLAGGAFADWQHDARQIRGAAPARPISLDDAAADVESQTGGRVVRIWSTDQDRAGPYEAIVLRGSSLTQLRVDPVTGRISRTASQEQPLDVSRRRIRAEARSLNDANVPLSQAIRTAEAAAGGPALGAGLATARTPENDIVTYNIAVASRGRVERIAGDAQTDQIIANPNSLGLPNQEPDWFLRGSYGAG